MSRPGRGARLAALCYGVAAAVYLADRLTKLWAEDALAGRPPIDVVAGALRLRFTTNSGGAFSLGTSAPLLFVGASLVVIAVVVAASVRLERPLVAVALGLVLGGGLGNLTDRIVRGPGLHGRVVDFIDLHVWPVFNLADSAIVVGAAMLLVAGVAMTRRPRVGPPADERTR